MNSSFLSQTMLFNIKQSSMLGIAQHTHIDQVQQRSNRDKWISHRIDMPVTKDERHWEGSRESICSNLSSFLVKLLQEKVSVLILNATLMYFEPPPGFFNMVSVYQHCSIACIQAHSFSIFVITTCLTAPVPMSALLGLLRHSSLSPPTTSPYKIPLGHL